LDRLQNVRRSGGEWTSLCPSHSDKTPSLSVKEESGKILLHCFAGCSVESITAAIGLTPRDLFTGANANGAGASQPPREVCAYKYEDEAGNLLYEVVRYFPKSFRQRRPDGKGGHVWNMDGVRRVLYQLRGIAGAEQVIICEGERDAETATDFQLQWTCGTTNVGGAGKWRADFNESLRGKHVVVVPDADEPGRKHAAEVAGSVLPVAASVKILELPAKDLTAWKVDGGTAEKFEALVRAAPIFSPERELFETLQNYEGEPMVSFAIENFLQNNAITGVGGLSGHGKTFVMLSIAKALLAGPPAKLWGLFPVLERAETVVYLIPESMRGPFKHRLVMMGLYQYIESGRLLTRTLESGPLDLTDSRLLSAIARLRPHVFLDTAIRFMSGDENKAEDNRSFAAEVFGLLKAGARTVVSAYHSPKGFRRAEMMDLEGAIRGGGDLGAALATCWALKQIDMQQNILQVENVKPRDFEPPRPFQLVGRPFLSDTGDFSVLKAPGECGSLAEEIETNEGKQQQRDDRVAMVRAWLEEDSNMSASEMAEKFQALGIAVKLDTVQRYRKQARKNP
jgi:hypothetical protein